MITNYLKTAWRSLIKDRKYSIINFLGLGIGIAASILIMLYVIHERSFDQFHSKSDQIHRMWVKEHVEGDVFFNTVTPLIMGSEARSNFAEVEYMTRFVTTNNLVKIDVDPQSETIAYAEPEFFTIFDFQIINGQSDLTEPGEVILSEDIAGKYFGPSDPIGKTISILVNNEWRDFQVAATASVSSNSSVRFDFLLPFEIYWQGVSAGGRSCWTCVFGETYVLLQPDLDGFAMQERSKQFFDERVSEIYEAGKYVVGYQPLTDIHLNNEFPVGIAAVSDSRYPYILGGIALLILVLAAINYITLAIGRTLSRSKEVGIRKVAGAGRMQIMLQYWSEAVLTTIMASVIGLLIAVLVLPSFNALFDLTLSLNYSFSLVASLILFAIVLGVLSAIYPSLVLSGFTPLQAISGKIGVNAASKHRILNTLVGAQFVISIVLIVATLIMKNQIDYLQNTDLGFNQEATLVVSSQGGSIPELIEKSKSQAEIFRSEIAAMPHVQSVTVSNHSFGTPGWMRLGYNEEESGVFRNFMMNGIDDYFLELFDIDILEGRNFFSDGESDRNAVIVNRHFVDEYEIEEPLSATLPGPFREYRIVGVVEDFHYESLHEAIAPLVLAKDPMGLLRTTPDLVFNDSPLPKFNFRLDANHLLSAVQSVKSLWSQHMPDQPFDFRFVEDDLAQMYVSEMRLSRMVITGAGLAIFIACLGLYGITGISMNRRKKEIGIRKVLGATLVNLLALFSKDFLKLISIAFLIAAPLAWWLMRQWLQDFAYSISISSWVFVMAAVFALLVALIAIGLQTVFHGLRNPVLTLREE